MNDKTFQIEQPSLQVLQEPYSHSEEYCPQDLTSDRLASTTEVTAEEVQLDPEILAWLQEQSPDEAQQQQLIAQILQGGVERLEKAEQMLAFMQALGGATLPG